MQDTLNSKIWQDGRLVPEIRDRLTVIASKFMESLDVGQPAQDIIFTGSLASYNWTDKSDVDLHVVLDFSAVDENAKLVKDYMLAKKGLWNDHHHIVIKGFPVELYAQDAAEPHAAQGIYSVLRDEWVKEPVKDQADIVDRPTVDKKVEQLQYDIDEALTAQDLPKLGGLSDKLRKMRSEGLAEGGEYSVGNQVFKALRHNGYLEKLSKGKLNITDTQLSLSSKELHMALNKQAVKGYVLHDGYIDFSIDPDTGDVSVQGYNPNEFEVEGLLDAYPAFANAYWLEQSYGGQEEGGWYYTRKNLLESVSVASEEQAKAQVVELFKKYENENDYLNSLSSTQSRGKVEVLVEQTAGESETKGRPRYESLKRQGAAMIKSASTRMAVVNDVLENGIYDDKGKLKKLEGSALDAFTASAMKSVYDALNPESQAKFDSIPLPRLLNFVWKMVKGSKIGNDEQAQVLMAISTKKIADSGDKFYDALQVLKKARTPEAQGVRDILDELRMVVDWGMAVDDPKQAEIFDNAQDAVMEGLASVKDDLGADKADNLALYLKGLFEGYGISMDTIPQTMRRKNSQRVATAEEAEVMGAIAGIGVQADKPRSKSLEEADRKSLKPLYNKIGNASPGEPIEFTEDELLFISAALHRFSQLGELFGSTGGEEQQVLESIAGIGVQAAPKKRKAPVKPKAKPAPAAAPAAVEFDEDGVKSELAAALETDAEGVEVEEGYADDTFKVTADGTEYEVMESEDAAEARALAQVKEDLNNEPELFTKDWLKSYIKLGDTDCRLLAQDLVGDYYREMKDGEVEKEYEREFGEVPKKGLDEAAQAKVDSLKEAAEAAWKVYQENQDDSKDEELQQVWYDADNLADEAEEEAGGGIDYDQMREELEEKKSEEYEKALRDDAYGFLVEEQGIYDEDSFFKQFGYSIDIDEAAQDAVSTDGWQHFLSRYDGNSDTTAAGFVYWRA